MEATYRDLIENLSEGELARLERLYAARLSAGDEGARSGWWAVMTQQECRVAMAEADAAEAERVEYDRMMAQEANAAADLARLGEELADGPTADELAAHLGLAA